MNTHNTPDYIVSSLKDELKRLGVDEDFVKDVDVFHNDLSEDGLCKSKFENGKENGVMLSVREEKSRRATKATTYILAKHAQQYFKRGARDVEEVNPVFNTIEAHTYGFKRIIEEDLKNVYTKLKGFFSRS